MKHMLKTFTLVLALLITATAFCSKSAKPEQWGFFEIELTGPQTGNPFGDVTLSAEFSQGGELQGDFSSWEPCQLLQNK